jgi:hypothetical protein
LAKLIIDNEQIAASFFEDAHLLGIQCPAAPHKFVWLINQHFGFDFRYEAFSEVALKKKERHFFFPVFSFSELHLSAHHIIYTNQFDGEYLLPELKFTDYLWLVKSDSLDGQFIPLLANELRKVPMMNLVTTLSNEKIKNKQRLVL